MAKKPQKQEKPTSKKTVSKKTAVSKAVSKKAVSKKPVSKKVVPKKVDKCACEKCKCKNGVGVTAIVLASLALAAAGTSVVFSVLAFQRQSSSLFGSGVDGNSTNFTEGSVADIVSKVSESVVSIVTSVKTTGYFGQTQSSQASGTGIIVSADGYVLTNKHVIDSASSISVVLADGTKYSDVAVAAVDPLNDIAFLKVKDVSGLTPATLGDSKTIQAGQQVVAIGNALGVYQNTVTAGVVSGTGRSLTASDASGTMSERLSDMIQTDAAINSGNSGGPLINAAGQVIGVNTANSYAAENMGFAIPIGAVKGMLAQLIEKGAAERAYVGVFTVQITPDIAKAYNLPVTAGDYLYGGSGNYSAIMKDSPAEKAGLKDKDIVTAVNDVKIGAAGSLSTLIAEYKPGDTVKLTVIREGQEITVDVTLEGYKSR